MSKPYVPYGTKRYREIFASKGQVRMQTDWRPLVKLQFV